MDFSKVKAGMSIEYIEDSMAFSGSYLVISAESTYIDPAKCPDHEKGKLMIVEFMNDDTPMFFTLDQLDANEWEF